MIRIILNPAYKDLEPFVQKVAVCFPQEGELIFQGRNQLKRYCVNGKNVIVKSFKPPHFINRFVYATIRSSKAKRSYEYGLELLKRGITTPMPIAYIEEYKWGLIHSFYVSEEISDAKEMRGYCNSPLEAEGVGILKAFGEFTAKMHKKQVLHQDYSAGNILYKIENDKPHFYLVDINRIHLDQPITEEDGYKSFKRLWFTEEAYTLLAHSYAQAMGYDKIHAANRILYYKNLFMKRKS